MEERTRAYTRYARRHTIRKRRQRITQWYGYTKGYELFPVDGKLAKESFPFSCSKEKAARQKKKTKTHGWKVSDIRQMIRIKDAWDEWLVN